MVEMRYFYLCLIVMSCLLLTSCEKGDRESKIVYIHNFPIKDSPELTEFIQNYFMKNRDIELKNRNELLIFSDGGEILDNEPLRYYQYTEDELKKYYQPLLNSDQPKEVLLTLSQDKTLERSLRRIVENEEDHGLPTITLEEGNLLKIKLMNEERVLNLPKILEQYGVKASDDIMVNVESITDKNLALSIQNFNVKDSSGEYLNIGIFVTKNLSHIEFTNLKRENLQKFVSDGKLKSFEDVLVKSDSTGRYLNLFRSDTIIDSKENKVLNIDLKDRLSEDRKYVFINGGESNLLDGIQKIQTVGDYFEKSDKYVAEFQLDYEKIAEKLNLQTNGPSFSTINYFNGHYIVIGINFTSKVVGTAGYTNVIIDLQKDKKVPTMYVVLDIT
ncbi:hypothetical protein [Metabacillus fastidiosus]|uniref:hypothetical protein n=1 Tax=Metabacillus fastidiosus TaxID=1458 RepID=UPI002DB656D4|nr:hypothetical protein [Metabacillus fastidiosus]MEC2075134.1 hypothetical protein [Metabacillus fastidiosus]